MDSFLNGFFRKPYFLKLFWTDMTFPHRLGQLEVSDFSLLFPVEVC